MAGTVCAIEQSVPLLIRCHNYDWIELSCAIGLGLAWLEG